MTLLGRKRARPAPGSAVLGLWFVLGGSPACSYDVDWVFRPVVVSFQTTESEASEGSPLTVVHVVTSAASLAPVMVSYEVTGGSASGHDDCGSRDYALAAGTLTFPPGEVDASIEIRHLNDTLPEPDEVLRISLTAVDGAALGETARHEHHILDDDRSVLLDVVGDFGAVGDGIADDTDAVAAAVERAESTPGAVVWFPRGTYAIVNVELVAGVGYYGEGATITRPPAQATDLSSFTVRYAAMTDSPLLVLRGLVLDGNRDAQGAFEDWQFENSDLLNVEADATQAGKLQIQIEDVTLRNTGGSGIVFGPNVDATICRIAGVDVWTDVIKFSGGASSLRARDVTAGGTLGTTGMTLTTLTAGVGDDYRVEIELERVQLDDGDLEISVLDGSSVTARDVHMARGPLYLRALDSSVRIFDSTLVVGAPEGRLNRIVAPTDVRFESTAFLLTESVEPTSTLVEEDRDLVAVDVIWDDVRFSEEGEMTVVEVLDTGSVVLEDCSFELAPDVETGDRAYVMATNEARDGGSVVVRGASVSTGFDDVLAPICGTCTLEPQ